MKTNYEIGEKVTIRKDLKETHWRYAYYPDWLITHINCVMVKYAGQVVTIGRNDEESTYRIVEDAGLHRWTWELFKESYEGDCYDTDY